MALMKILALLLLALVIAIPLLERFGKPASEQDTSALGRWVLPLVMLLALLQLLFYWFGN